MPVMDQTAQDLLGTDAGALSLRELREHRDCVALLNEEARVVALSPRGLEAVGLDADEARGLSWWSLWPDEVQAPLRTAFERGIAGQISTYCVKAGIGREGPRDWDIRVTPVSNGPGRISSVLVICQDVSAAL